MMLVRAWASTAFALLHVLQPALWPNVCVPLHGPFTGPWDESGAATGTLHEQTTHMSCCMVFCGTVGSWLQQVVWQPA
jgi:hypothetical protein